jgi:hypothetical protein
MDWEPTLNEPLSVSEEPEAGAASRRQAADTAVHSCSGNA